MFSFPAAISRLCVSPRGKEMLQFFLTFFFILFLSYSCRDLMKYFYDLFAFFSSSCRRQKCDHLAGVTYWTRKHESGRWNDVVYSALVLVPIGSLFSLSLYTYNNYRAEFQIESKFS